MYCVLNLICICVIEDILFRNLILGFFENNVYKNIGILTLCIIIIFLNFL